MINVIVPITKDVEEFSAFVSKYASKTTKFFVGVTESLAEKFDCKKKDVEVHIYKDGAKVEEIVNALGSCKREKGKLLIARRALSDEEYAKLTTSDKDIVSLKAVRSKFATKLKNFATKLIKKVFAFSYFEDISAICYGEGMYELLSVCPNLSNASRLNRYVGVSVEEIETETKPVKKEYGKAENIMNLLLGTVFFIGTILTIILLGITSGYFFADGEGRIETDSEHPINADEDSQWLFACGYDRKLLHKGSVCRKGRGERIALVDLVAACKKDALFQVFSYRFGTFFFQVHLKANHMPLQMRENVLCLTQRCDAQGRDPLFGQVRAKRIGIQMPRKRDRLKKAC